MKVRLAILDCESTLRACTVNQLTNFSWVCVFSAMFPNGVKTSAAGSYSNKNVLEGVKFDLTQPRMGEKTSIWRSCQQLLVIKNSVISVHKKKDEKENWNSNFLRKIH